MRKIKIEQLKKLGLTNVAIEIGADNPLEIHKFLTENTDVFFLGIGEPIQHDNQTHFNQKAFYITEKTWKESNTELWFSNNLQPKFISFEEFKKTLKEKNEKD